MDAYSCSNGIIDGSQSKSLEIRRTRHQHFHGKGLTVYGPNGIGTQLTITDGRGLNGYENAIIYANNTDIVRLQKQSERGKYAFLNSILYAYNSSNITVDCERGWFNCQNMSIYTYDDSFSILNPSIPDKLTIICSDVYDDECYQVKVYTSYNDYNDIWSCMYIHNGSQWNCIEFIESLSPTSSPTIEPTTETLLPTIETSVPTLETASPTLSTIQPTIETSVPTIETSVPTNLPTSTPTLSTLEPTVETSVPTIEPTIETILPTTQPTTTPTVMKTFESIPSNSQNNSKTIRVIVLTNAIVFSVAISLCCLVIIFVQLYRKYKQAKESETVIQNIYLSNKNGINSEIPNDEHKNDIQIPKEGVIEETTLGYDIGNV